MRRIGLFVLIVCLICSLAVGVGAATAAQTVGSFSTVSSDGSCQVTLTATVRLDQPVADLYFPLPGESTNVTVNGSRARSRVENGLRLVDISGIAGKVAGNFSLTFTYALPDIITTNKAGLLEMQLPMLSGFAYPVQFLEFSVTLPGPVTAKPAFSSGYHQANIEKDIRCTVSGATISGVAQTELKDHETLMMTLLVSEDMFPRTRMITPDFELMGTLTTVFTLLALAYWLLFLRNIPAWPARRATPPDGYNAGELAGVLHLQGGDLSLMIFSWAQLGYVQIGLQPGGAVHIYRQMDMGNERSSFERRCFKLLFGRYYTVDTASTRYLEACRSVQKLRPNLSSLVHPKSGNLYVFRALAALAGLFCGVSIALGLSSGAALQWVLAVLLGALALASSYCIQRWAVTLFAFEKRRLWIALGLCGLWLLLGALGGQLGVGFSLALGQLTAGLLAAFGGRRTYAGRQAMGETIGLRRYLKLVSKDQLQHICRNNPEYFHQMMPYALALGIDERFAKRFGKELISQCPYISMGADSAMRALQWRDLMRRVLKEMNAFEQRNAMEKIRAFVGSFLK